MLDLHDFLMISVVRYWHCQIDLGLIPADTYIYISGVNWKGV